MNQPTIRARPVAVVTGASRGLGAATARRLADDGWAVACMATTSERAEPICAELAADGATTLAVGARVENRDELDSALDEVETALGPIRLMVNNAGVAHVKPFLETDAADFTKVVDVNMVGVFHGSQAAARRMVASGVADDEAGGAIVQVGSIAGRNGFPNRVGYCGTKAAVHHMTKVMAIDLAPHNIRVNVVAPGYIRTDMIDELIETGAVAEGPLNNRIPQQRLGTPEQVASAVAWLASTEASYVTGEILTVDGGWVAYGHI